MAINSLYLVRSGVSGWLDTHNTGISLHKENFGVGVGSPDYKFHLANTGGFAQLAIQDSHYWMGYPGTDPKAQISLIDASGNVFGALLHERDLTLRNTTVSGAVILSVEDGHKAYLSPSGDFGINITDPKARLHALQDVSGVPVAILQNTHDTTPFKVTDDGRIGINVPDPDYTLHITGHYGLTAGGVGTIYSESYVYKQNELSVGAHSGVLNHVIDFDGPTYRNINLTGSGITNFGTANPALINDEVKSVSVKLYADDGFAKGVAFDNNIRFLGIKPTGLPADKVAVFAVNSFGTDPTDTVAVWREEGEEVVGERGPPGPVVTGEPGNGFTNKIIGGDFDTNPWQRGNLFTFDSASGVWVNEYTADRFAITMSGSGYDHLHLDNLGSGASLDVYKTGDAPIVGGKSGLGFPVLNSLGILQNRSITFKDQGYAMLEHRVEGYNWRPLSHNNFNLTFFVKTNRTGSHAVALSNYGYTESYVSTYNVYDTGVWEKKNLNIPKINPTYFSQSGITGYSSDATIPAGWNYENGIGLRVGWVLAAGTGYDAPMANAWAEGGNLGFSGNFVEFCGTGIINCPTGLESGDYFNIAAVQLQKNHFFNPRYQVRSVGQELDLCQRYCESFDYVSGQNVGMAQAIGTDVARGLAFRFEETKRDVPGVTYNGKFLASNSIWTEWGLVTGFTTGAASTFSVNLGCLTSGGLLTQGSPTTIAADDISGKIIIDSELY